MNKNIVAGIVEVLKLKVMDTALMVRSVGYV
jgi:hypothetical protein